MTLSWTSILATSAVVGVVGVGAYLVYFDQKRQSDPAFRRKLQKKKRSQAKQAPVSEVAPSATESKDSEREAARAALALVGNDPLPVTADEREAFFTAQLQRGETLFRMGPKGEAEAAVCFFRALKVYPAPMELLVIFQKTVPPTVFALVMAMMAEEVQTKQAAYWTLFPPPALGVTVSETQTGTSPDGKKIIRRGLRLTRAVSKGDIVYSEQAVIACASSSFSGSPAVCAHCLNTLPTDTPAISTPTFVYCSTPCQEAAFAQYDVMLAPTDSLAAENLLAYVRTNDARTTLILAKFLAKMVWEEHQKSLNPSPTGEEDLSAWDHLEKLHYLDLKAGTESDKKEWQLVQAVIGAKVPGFDEFLNFERFLMLKGKFLYNSIGIHAPTTRSPAPTLPTPSQTPTPALLDSDSDKSIFIQRQCRSASDPSSSIGAGMYQTTAYMAHSCTPNVEFQFSGSKLSVVALEDLELDAEILNSWVEIEDPAQIVERRKKLSKRYRLKCSCAKCEMEKAQDLKTVTSATTVVAVADVDTSVGVGAGAGAKTVASGESASKADVKEMEVEIEDVKEAESLGVGAVAA